MCSDALRTHQLGCEWRQPKSESQYALHNIFSKSIAFYFYGDFVLDGFFCLLMLKWLA